MKQLYLLKVPRKLKQLINKKKKKRQEEPSNIQYCKRCLRRIDAEKTPAVNNVCAFCWKPEEIVGGFKVYFENHFSVLKPMDGKQVKEFGELVCHYQQAGRCLRIVRRFVLACPYNRTAGIIAGLDHCQVPILNRRVYEQWRDWLRPELVKLYKENKHRATLFDYVEVKKEPK